MRADPNFPGLQVCDQGCADNKDPYRLPARPTEKITIRFPRPDTDIAVTPDAIQTTGGDVYDLSPQRNIQNPSNTGNLDNLSPTPGR